MPQFINSLNLYFYDFAYFSLKRKNNSFSISPEHEATMTTILRRKHNALGPMTFHETVVLVLFNFLLLLWIFRSPGFMTGWADLFRYAFPDM